MDEECKDTAPESKATRKEVDEAERREPGIEVATEPEASGEGEEERKQDHGVREVVPESPHRRRRRRKRSEASRTRSPKNRRRGESSHRRRRRASSRPEDQVVRPTHAPEGREERREARRPRSPSNPLLGLQDRPSCCQLVLSIVDLLTVPSIALTKERRTRGRRRSRHSGTSRTTWRSVGPRKERPVKTERSAGRRGLNAS